MSRSTKLLSRAGRSSALLSAKSAPSSYRHHTALAFTAAAPPPSSTSAPSASRDGARTPAPSQHQHHRKERRTLHFWPPAAGPGGHVGAGSPSGSAPLPGGSPGGGGGGGGAVYYPYKLNGADIGVSLNVGLPTSGNGAGVYPSVFPPSPPLVHPRPLPAGSKSDAGGGAVADAGGSGGGGCGSEPANGAASPGPSSGSNGSAGSGGNSSSGSARSTLSSTSSTPPPSDPTLPGVLSMPVHPSPAPSATTAADPSDPQSPYAPSSAHHAYPPLAVPQGSRRRHSLVAGESKGADRRDFGFRTGAYGIPKRHPLSGGSGPPSRPPSGSTFEAGSERQRSWKGKGKEKEKERSPDPPPIPVDPSSSRERPSSSSLALDPSSSSSACPQAHLSVSVGEDAYFLLPSALGIADGVGGWAGREGADPAMFSRLLMHFCADEATQSLAQATILQRDAGTKAGEGAEGRGEREEGERREGSGEGFERSSERYQRSRDGSEGEDVGRGDVEQDPVELMQRGWERCVRAAQAEGIIGSSTALLALLIGDELRVANIGDSVLMLIRPDRPDDGSGDSGGGGGGGGERGSVEDGRSGATTVSDAAFVTERLTAADGTVLPGQLIFRTLEQQHSFNFPVQLGMMGAAEGDKRAHGASATEGEGEGEGEEDEARRRAAAAVSASDARSSTSTTSAEDYARKAQLRARKAKFAQGRGLADGGWDEPRRDAGRWTVKVEKGDIVVLGSDGLVDNLFDEDIVEEVLKFVQLAQPCPSPSSPDTGTPSSADASFSFLSLYPPPTSNSSDDSSMASSEDSSSSASSPPSSAGKPPSSPAMTTAGETTPCRPRSPTPLSLRPCFSPQLVSEALCSRAKAVSQDTRAVSSPFQQRAMEEGLSYAGGKRDDITVLVAVVGEGADVGVPAAEPEREPERER